MDYDDIRTQINASNRHLQAQAEMLQEQFQANEYLYELLDRIRQLERDNADLQREVRNGEQIIASTASLLNTSRLECAQAKEELAKLKLRLAEEGLPVINNTFNVQHDLLYQPEQVTYSDSQLLLETLKKSS